MTGPRGGEVVAKILQAVQSLTASIVDNAGPRISAAYRGFPRAIQDGLSRITHQDKVLGSEFDMSVPSAHLDRGATAEHSKSSARVRGHGHGPDPTVDEEFLGLPIEEQLLRLEAAHGIHTDAERALELSLFMEDKFRDIALISRQTRPETIFDGLEGWASWLDARLFARRNLDREMSVDLLQEIHRKLRIRHAPEDAGRMQGARRSGFGLLSRALSPSERAAIEENPLLTYVPGPFRTEPYGIVFQPKVENQLGARVARWPEAPPTAEELAAIRNDPLRAYQGPDTPLRGITEHGAIVYPNFGSVDGTRKFHEALCDWHNNARKLPGYEPYRSAAEFQKQLISAHSWEGPFHGRHSRVAMNFLLEQAGEPPSAVAEFDKDLFASTSQWAEEVEEGSRRYRQWQHKLEQSGGDIDPVDLSDLRPMMQRYQQMGGESSPFVPGAWHDAGEYERLHMQLRLAA